MKIKAVEFKWLKADSGGSYFYSDLETAPGEYVRKEVAERLKAENEVLESMSRHAPSPCGHSSQYAYTEDGGKHIICLLCSNKRLLAENQRMISIAGEAIGTQPEQRGPETVEVLANHARRLAEEIVRLRKALRQIADNNNTGNSAKIAVMALGGGDYGPRE